MKLISVKQPWASLIVNGGLNRKGELVYKDVENKGVNSHHRGRLGIHASQSKTGLNGLIEYVANNYDITVDETKLVFGAVIGSVEMVDCVFGKHPSIWYVDGYGYVLEQPFAYPKPIPLKGQLGIYERPDIAGTLARYERLRKGAAMG